MDRRRADLRVGWVPWLGLTLGLAASLAANVAAAKPDLVAQLVAAWPPLALAVSIETLVIVLRNTTTAESAEPAPSMEQRITLLMMLANLHAAKPRRTRRPAPGSRAATPTPPSSLDQVAQQRKEHERKRKADWRARKAAINE